MSISTDCKTSLRADNAVRGDTDNQCMAITTGDQNQAGVVAMQAAALFRGHLRAIPQHVRHSFEVRHPSCCRRRHTIATGLRILLFHRGVQHDEQENRDSTHPQSAYFSLCSTSSGKMTRRDGTDHILTVNVRRDRRTAQLRTRR